MNGTYVMNKRSIAKSRALRKQNSLLKEVKPATLSENVATGKPHLIQYTKRSNIADVLTTIAKNLEHSDSNWVIIASSALALHGLDVDPTDVDIMMTIAAF